MGLTLFESELTTALRIFSLFLFLLSSVSMISAEASELSTFLYGERFLVNGISYQIMSVDNFTQLPKSKEYHSIKIFTIKQDM